MSENNNIPTVTMLIGLPGSGKSTWAKTQTATIHSASIIRKQLFGETDEIIDNKQVFERLHQNMINDLQQNKDVIFDATNLTIRDRASFLNKLKDIPCKKIAVVMAIPIRECLDKNQQHPGSMSNRTIRKMYGAYQRPYKSEGFDEILYFYQGQLKPSEFEMSTAYSNTNDTKLISNIKDWITMLPESKSDTITVSLVSSKFKIPTHTAKTILKSLSYEGMLDKYFAGQCPKCKNIIKKINENELYDFLQKPETICSECFNDVKLNLNDIYITYQRTKTNDTLKMRDATPEEIASTQAYIQSISKPTGFNFFE